MPGHAGDGGHLRSINLYVDCRRRVSRAARATSNFRWKDGPEVYAKVCSYCHDQQIGPVIRGRSLPPAYISAVVRNGNRAMPAFRASEIDDESLKKVAEYISTN